MNISRIKFVLLFLVFAFVFLFVTTGVLDQTPESFIGMKSQVPWKATVSTILSPIKIILIGPLLPFIQFLHQDPDTPPPFFLVGFAIYWTILALLIHYLAGKMKPAKWFKDTANAAVVHLLITDESCRLQQEVPWWLNLRM